MNCFIFYLIGIRCFNYVTQKNGYPIRIEILATIQIEWTGIVFAMNLSLPEICVFQ